MKWFKHDSDANMDSKLQEVLLDYGLEGYGLYWYCLELITNKIDVDNLTFELEHDARIIARNTGSTTQRVSEMMTRFIELGLFSNSSGNITCLKLLSRLDKSMTSNIKMRSLIDKAKDSHDSVMINPDLVMQDKKRIEENRRDNNKEKIKRNVFKKPTTEEIIEYCDERKNNVDPESFMDYYTSNGWKVGKNPMKDWKAAIRQWEKNSGARRNEGVSKQPDNAATRHLERSKRAYEKAIAEELDN